MPSVDLANHLRASLLQILLHAAMAEARCHFLIVNVKPPLLEVLPSNDVFN